MNKNGSKSTKGTYGILNGKGTFTAHCNITEQRQPVVLPGGGEGNVPPLKICDVLILYLMLKSSSLIYMLPAELSSI